MDLRLRPRNDAVDSNFGKVEIRFLPSLDRMDIGNWRWRH